MVESDDYFLPESFVRERIGARHGLSILRIPAAGAARRIAWFEDWSRQYRERPGTVFLSGDGLLLYPFRDTLVGSGVNADRIRIRKRFSITGKRLWADLAKEYDGSKCSPARSRRITNWLYDGRLLGRCGQGGGALPGEGDRAR